MDLDRVTGSWEAARKAIRAEKLAAYDDSVRAHEALVAIHKREALIDRAVRTVVFERGKVKNDPVYKTCWPMIADWYYADICKEIQNQQLGLISSGGIGNPPFNEWILPIHGRNIDIPQPPSRP